MSKQLWNVALFFTLFVLASVSQAAQGWKAGVATTNITPKRLMWMAGYGSRNHPAEGKTTDLWAKALVLEDANNKRAVLLTLDLVGIDRQLSNKICGTLKERHGLERAQISICTSHTHSGPVVGQNLAPLHYLQVNDEQQSLIDQYAVSLHETVTHLVGNAIKTLRPCQLQRGKGTATFAVNRRENRESDVLKLRADNQLKGPVDHDVPVLAVRDEDGKLRCVVFGYACHATVLSFYQWCADYPGYAQEELQNRHEDCVAMFWAGCGADQNPLPRREVELAQKYGRMLADAVDEVLDANGDRAMKTVAPHLATRYAELAAPLDKIPSKDHWVKAAGSSNRFEAARAKMLLQQINAGKPLDKTYPYPVQCWRLGDVTWVMLGGEVVVDYALRLKVELKSSGPIWVAGYANDVMAYIPSRRVLREGGYEGGGSMVYYGLPTVWAPDVENLIVNMAKRLAH